ncbi:MAG TPA: response regulator [Candidatus Aminicenantes bacterium]|nr:response regulator [Candidatus Aminicenantes bacterium]
MPYTIVLADPSPSVQKAAQLVFAEPEFRLSVFEDGASLVEAAAGLRPDALVVSLTLPGRDGYEVGRVLRGHEELRDIPLVGLKGTFESLDRDAPPPAEYDEIVLKPFDSERLASLVRELIARKTGPPSLPEDPLWLGQAGETGPAGAKPSAAAAGPDLKAVIHGEIVAMEREIEKRVRASLLAELKEWRPKT